MVCQLDTNTVEGVTMKIAWTEDQRTLLRKIVPHIAPMDDLNDDMIILLAEEVGHYLVLHGVDLREHHNEVGRLCESIINKLSLY